MRRRAVLLLVVAAALLHAHDASAASWCAERAEEAARLIVVRDLTATPTWDLHHGRCVVTLTMDVPK